MYTEVMRKPETKMFLDVGCCFGTDMRILVRDSATKSKVFGVETIPEFVSLGRELFDDDSFVNQMLVCDALEPDFPQKVATLAGFSSTSCWDVIHMGSLLHLLLEDQLVHLLNSVLNTMLAPGGVLFGQCVGKDAPGLHSSASVAHGLRFLHSSESLKSMFLRAAPSAEVTVRWRYQATDDQLGFLEFFVRLS